MSNNRNRNRHKKHQVEDNYIPPFAANLLAQPIEDLKLRDTTFELLKGAGFVSIFDVVKKSENDFYRIIRFNKKNLIDLKYHLNGMKLFLKPQEEPVPAEGAESAERPGQPNSVLQRGNASPQRERRENPNRENRGQMQNGQQRPFPQGRDRQASAAPRDQRDARTQNRADANRNQQQNDRNKNNFNDGVSEKRTKELREKARPAKTVVTPVQDAYVKVNKGGKWGFSDRKGKVIVEPIYDEIFSFKEDLCCVEVDERAGYINRQGEVIIEPQYECGSSFSEGLACVFKGGRCGYINPANEVVVDFEFDAGTAFEEGACRVKKDGKWGELFFETLEDGQRKTVIRWII